MKWYKNHRESFLGFTYKINKRELRCISVQALNKALTTALTLRLFRSLYVCPVPTNTIGWPVVYVMEIAAPT